MTAGQKVASWRTSHFAAFPAWDHSQKTNAVGRNDRNVCGCDDNILTLALSWLRTARFSGRRASKQLTVSVTRTPLRKPRTAPFQPLLPGEHANALATVRGLGWVGALVESHPFYPFFIQFPQFPQSKVDYLDDYSLYPKKGEKRNSYWKNVCRPRQPINLLRGNLWKATQCAQADVQLRSTRPLIWLGENLQTLQFTL